MPGKLFSDIDASILGTEHPGLLLINAKLLGRGEAAEQEAIAAINRELAELTTNEVAPAELTRCVNRLESDRVFSMMSPLHKAQALAMAEMHGESIDDILPRYRAVTPAVIRATAADLFRPTRSMTLIYRPTSD